MATSEATILTENEQLAGINADYEQAANDGSVVSTSWLLRSTGGSRVAAVDAAAPPSHACKHWRRGQRSAGPGCRGPRPIPSRCRVFTATVRL